MQVGVVSAGFFGFFDAPPVLGRYYTATEDAAPVGAPVVVLSWRLLGDVQYWRDDTTAVGLTCSQADRRDALHGDRCRTPGLRGNVAREAADRVCARRPRYAAEKGAHLDIRGEKWWTTYHWTWARGHRPAESRA